MAWVASQTKLLQFHQCSGADAAVLLALSLALWCWTVLKYSDRTRISFRASKVFLEWNQLECLWPCCHSYQMLLGSDAWCMTCVFTLQVTSWKCKSPSWPHLRETLTFYLNCGMTRQHLFTNQNHVILLEYQMCYTRIPDRALRDSSKYQKMVLCLSE